MKEQLREIPRKWGSWRDRLRDRRAANLTYRIVVGVIGLAVLTVGIAAIPYPGPGWAIVFVGLGILATEFEWAHRLLHYARDKYAAVMDWFARQGWPIQLIAALFTAAVVVASLWLLGALGFMAGLVGLDWQWLKSPIGLGS
ncbi:MAG: TIGR02611 family protein [Mycobacterium sp.]